MGFGLLQGLGKGMSQVGDNLYEQAKMERIQEWKQGQIADEREYQAGRTAEQRTYQEGQQADERARAGDAEKSRRDWEREKMGIEHKQAKELYGMKEKIKMNPLLERELDFTESQIEALMKAQGEGFATPDMETQLKNLTQKRAFLMGAAPPQPAPAAPGGVQDDEPDQAASTATTPPLQGGGDLQNQQWLNQWMERKRQDGSARKGVLDRLDRITPGEGFQRDVVRPFSDIAANIGKWILQKGISAQQALEARGVLAALGDSPTPQQVQAAVSRYPFMADHPDLRPYLNAR